MVEHKFISQEKVFHMIKGLSNFQPLEVVDRGSETQPQVVENLNPQNEFNRA